MHRLVPAILLFLAGCNLVLSPGEAQCETADDCAARGFVTSVCVDRVCIEPPDRVWGCLGNVVKTEPEPGKKVEFTIGFVYAGSKTPVPGLTVDVCEKLDIECTGSGSGAPKGLVPGVDGILKISVNHGFDGFMRIFGSTVVDTRVFVGRPIVEPPAPKEVWLLQKSDYDILAAAAKLTVDSTRGTTILLAHDCQGLSASGVRFECSAADDASTEFYLTNQLPVTPPAATSTDVDGYGGFFNVPTGALVVARAVRASDGVFIGESSFQVLADTISYVQIAPTPK